MDKTVLDECCRSEEPPSHEDNLEYIHKESEFYGQWPAEVDEENESEELQFIRLTSVSIDWQSVTSAMTDYTACQGRLKHSLC